MADFRKGDIVQNIFAGKNNPTRFLLYIGKGTCGHSHKVYDCIGYDGNICNFFSGWPDQYSTGHMDYVEPDAFCSYGERKDGGQAPQREDV